ncbi:MAG TPA: AAA family ATPase [Kineosporiaceae bacterium]
MTVVTPGPPPPEGEVHVPPSSPPDDPRFPWKSRGTRKPLPFWDRSKFLILFSVIFGVLVWYDVQRFSPPATLGEIIGSVGWDQQWVLWLAGIEFVRQLHFLVSEHSRAYHHFWSQTVFGGTTRRYEQRFNPWNRYRIARVAKWVFLVVMFAVLLGRITGNSPLVALFKVPAMFVAALPFILQIVLVLFITIIQFVAMFWFLSRGGVETYFPDDIETRFSDVWGQDHVLARVKENVILLENPEAIEEKGGHVPSGILLYGPPGTGKTLMAEAVAGETGKPYVFVDPGAFTAMFFGIGVLKVKSLFRKLRKLALRYGGVIVFFDEADTLGSRGARAGGAQPVGGATPAPWSDPACGGPMHLSALTRSELHRHTVGEPEPVPGRSRLPFVAGAGLGGGSSSFDGTLQALLTELSGLKKPRGFINRVVRRTLGMKPKPPPKYRILVMMASNLPEALDPALLRPGRIDRIYRVGYPSKTGRVRTYQGYLDKTRHNLTTEQVDKLATITPYATGAEMKDLVNEALIHAIREERDVITWRDVVAAKHLKTLGPPEDVEYIERERHAVAVHEACHAVAAWATRRHMEIDLATIEKGSSYLGMVQSIKPEDQYTQWRSEYESDIVVSVASLAGERLFYGGDNSSGVSGDLRTATMIATLMESHWGMGAGISSLPALQDLGIQGGGTPEERKGSGKGGIGFGVELKQARRDEGGGPLPQRIEAILMRLLEETEQLLQAHRGRVLALAHALETHKTLAGEDVVAVLEGKVGELVDGRPYADPAFIQELERYHQRALEAHERHAPLRAPLPVAPGVLMGEVVPSPGVAASTPLWATAAPAGSTSAGPGTSNGIGPQPAQAGPPQAPPPPA